MAAFASLVDRASGGNAGSSDQANTPPVNPPTPERILGTPNHTPTPGTPTQAFAPSPFAPLSFAHSPTPPPPMPLPDAIAALRQSVSSALDASPGRARNLPIESPVQPTTPLRFCAPPPLPVSPVVTASRALSYEAAQKSLAGLAATLARRPHTLPPPPDSLRTRKRKRDEADDEDQRLEDELFESELRRLQESDGTAYPAYYDDPEMAGFQNVANY